MFALSFILFLTASDVLGQPVTFPRDIISGQSIHIKAADVQSSNENGVTIEITKPKPLGQTSTNEDDVVFAQGPSEVISKPPHATNLPANQVPESEYPPQISNLPAGATSTGSIILPIIPIESPQATNLPAHSQHIPSQSVEYPEQQPTQSTPTTTYQQPTLGQIIEYLNEIAKITIKQQSQSIGNTYHSIVSASKETIKAGLDAAKTGLGFILVIPQFGVNALLNLPNKANNDNQTKA